MWDPPSPGSRDEPTCSTPFHPMGQEGTQRGSQTGAGDRGTPVTSAGSRRKDAADSGAKMSASNVPQSQLVKNSKYIKKYIVALRTLLNTPW